MVFQVPQFWAIASDGFQISLYLLILGFYIKNRLIHKKNASNKTEKASRQSFNAHVFNLTAQQQVNQAFTNIIKTIAAERNGLEGVLGLNALSRKDNNIYKAPPNSKLPNRYDHHRISADRTRSAEQHDKVRKISAKGLSARKISEALKIPMGEVELILSLQNK